MPQYALCHTHLHNFSTRSCYLCAIQVLLMILMVKVTAYTVLAYSAYLVGLYEVLCL